MKYTPLLFFICSAVACIAAAQVSFAERFVYNPVSGHTESERGRSRPNFSSPQSPTPRAHAARQVLAGRGAARQEVAPTSPQSPPASEQAWSFVETQAAVDPVDFQTEAGGDTAPFDPSDAEYHWEDPDHNFGDQCGCGDCVSSSQCVQNSRHNWYAGFEATFLQPRFADNTAFTVMESDGSSFENFSDTEFDYGLEFAPRVFVGLKFCDGVGFQATWWQFGHDPDALSAQPPANGFGEISSPQFGDFDISTTIPGDTFSAASGLDAYTIDLEVTTCGGFSSWLIGVSGGVRYASLEQRYFAQTADSNADLLEQIDFQHTNEGFGPTISLSGSLPVNGQIDLFCKGRGSLLFGDATSRLNAGEDLDLSTPFTTSKNSSRSSLLPIAELQLGLRWRGAQHRYGVWQPFATVGMEAQHWSEVGDVAGEVGDLGFFGLVTSVGASW